MRTFIALELPERFAAETAELARQLSAAIDGRFMRRNTYHLTVEFIGEIDSLEVDAIAGAIDDVCATHEAITLKPEGLGKFGRASDATLWLGLTATPELMSLATDVREALSARGIGFDAKAFRPHVTLARRARIPKGGLPGLAFPREAVASEVALFKSTLSSEGAAYEELHVGLLGEN